MKKLIKLSLLLLTIQLSLVGISAQKATSPVRQKAQTLEPNELIVRRLKGGESHSYHILLEANQFLRVSVEQLGIDVEVSLYAPDGKLLEERDRPNGTLGEESLSSEVPISGKYKIEVKTLEKEAKEGKYQIKIEAPRSATSQDKKRIEAEKAFQDGMKLDDTGTNESFTIASEKYEIASKNWNELGDSYAEGMALYQLARTYKWLSETDKAIESVIKALAIHQVRKDRAAEGDDLYLLGILMESQDKVDEAIRYLEDAAIAKKETNNADGELFDFLAKTYSRVQKLPQAIEAQKKAIEIHRNNLNVVAQIQSVFDLGEFYQLNGDDENATKCYEEAAQLVKTITKKKESVEVYKKVGEGLSRLGIMKFRSGDFPKALEVIGRALTLFESVNDKPNIAHNHNLIGLSYFSNGENNLAEAQFQQSLTIFRSLGDKSGEARALFNLRKLNPTSLKPQIAEISVQIGHPTGAIYTVFSPDGKVLASTGIDGAIVLWDVETRKQIRTLKGIGGPVMTCAFSPDGKLIVGGGFVFAEADNSNTLKVWDVETGNELFNLQGHRVAVKSVAFTPDGKTIVSGGTGPIRQWDVASGQQIRWLVKGGTLVALSHDGKSLISGKLDSTLALWDLTSVTVKHTFIGHKKDIYSVAFCPTENKVASASTDGTIKIWRVETGKILQTFEAPIMDDSSIFAGVVFSPDGQLISWADTKKTTLIWNVETGKEVLKLSEIGENYATAFSPDGKIFARGVGRDIKLWEIHDNKELSEIKANSSTQFTASFSRDGEVLGMAHSGDSIISLLSKKGWQKLQTPFSFGVDEIAFNQGGKLLATGTFENAIKLWNITENKELYTFIDCANKSTLSPNGRMLACVSKDKKTVKLFAIESGKEVGKIDGQFDEVDIFQFSPDGNMFGVQTSMGKGFQLWNVNQRTKTFDFLTSKVAFSFDGKLMATSRSERVWIRKVDDLSSEGWTELTGNMGAVLSLEFSPDGKVLASGGFDKSIRLWDTNTFKEIKTFDGHNSFVSKISFSPDGKTLVSLGADSNNKLWNVSTGKEIVSFISLSENEWAIVTPDGLFDASVAGRKMLHYVVGLEPIALEQMKELYYVPGLLQKIFKGDPLPKVELFSKKDLFPDVEFSQPQAGQEDLTVKLTNRGGGIGQVQILVNGKEFVGDARPKGFDSNAKDATLTVSLKDAPFIVGKENRIEIIAKNAAGSLSTRGTPRGTAVFNLGGNESREKPNIYVIVGGISNYTNDNLKLGFAAKDAEDFAKAVEIGAVKLLGDKSKVHIRLLTSNGTNSTAKFDIPDAKISTATKTDFEKAFADFKDATPNDVFIVYLSGHGVALNLNQNPSQAGGDTYLYLTQEATTTDKSILTVENSRKAMAISSEELKDLMKTNKALKQVLILDTCAAGALSNSLVKRDLPSDQIRAIERLKDNTGFYVLMGSSADAFSYEASQYGQGLLTYSLLQGMKGAKLRENQFADVNLLFSYAQETVPNMAKNIGGIQRPLIITPDNSASFDIGKFTSEEQQRINLSNPKPIILRPVLQNREQDFDDLELTKLLQAKLREANYVAIRGENAALVFVDADEMVDAVKPSGSYLVKGDEITVTLRLIRNKIPIETLTVSGKVSQKEELINALVLKITQYSQIKP